MFMGGSADIMGIVDYHAETRFGVKYVDTADPTKGHESDPRSFNGGTLIDGITFSQIRTYTITRTWSQRHSVATVSVKKPQVQL